MKYFLFLFISVFSYSQQIDKVDFIKCNAIVSTNFDLKSVDGTISYEFKVLSDIDSIRIDAKNMEFKSVLINGKSVNYKNSKKELIFFEGFKKGKNKLKFLYSVTPNQTMYFTGVKENYQIWTQGQGKYTSHWLPSFDDVNEKVVFNISVIVEKEMSSLQNFIPISNGKLIKKETTIRWSEGINYNKFSFSMKQPMSSYLVMLAIGKFEHKTEKSNSGIPLENYYQQKDLLKYQYTYKYSKTIFDFLEKEIGVKYPWQIYRQIPVEDFLYAGMENTSSTIFAQDFVVDENGFNDRNYINVNAHELAHQWFGDLITAKSGKHHWLQEGFATYYALLAERKLFGEDYFYYQLYKNAEQLKEAVKTDTIPVMNEKASSLSFYQKGAWALHTIRESIGVKKFNKAVKTYLKKHKFKNVVTSNFLEEVAKVSDFDIDKFQKEWLEDYHFQNNEVDELLNKNEFIRKLIEVKSLKSKPFSEKQAFFIEEMRSNIYYPIKKEIIYQLVSVPFEDKKEVLKIAMNTNDIEVRQAVAEILNTIPLSFKEEYETLLNDKSYDTKEIAFVKLFTSFPDNQAKYLEMAKDWIGKNDKSLRITFLTAYQTFKDADNNLKTKYYNELVDYSSSKYESSIRTNALENLLELNPKDENVLKNLVNATTHHKWQFVKYARDKIREFLKQDNYKDIFINMISKLNLEEKNQLNRLIN